MTYLMQDNFNIYDSLPCSAVVFEMNENLDIVYSNAIYDSMFGSRYIKIEGIDRDVFDKIISTADEPKHVYFKSRDAHGKTIDVRAFVIKIADNKAFALFIDDNENAAEIRKLTKACERYAAAIRGTDEIFYEYIKENDSLTIFFPTKEGTIQTKHIDSFFAKMEENKFIYDDDFPVLKELEDNVKIEKHFEFRMRLRDDEDYEWYSVAAKPESEHPGIFVGTARNINESKAEEERLKEKAFVDPLSKVYNRAAAIEKIEKQLNLRLEDCECALLVLDIDNFKRINDTYGHLYGDAVIAMAAGSIKSTLDEGDIIGRFGGDEFFVFIDNAEKEALEKKLEAIRLSILKMRLDQNDDNDISCSIGVALGNGASVYEELFRQADSALYKAKENGKNRFEYFDGTYTADTTISYTSKPDEHESNEAHNVTAIALEIASKSTNAESAVINIMRHIGMALELDCIQILRYDTIEDKVDLEFQWWKERNGEYNVAETEKRTGYYNHNDLILFKNRFTKDRIFRQTVDFEEGFSQKYQDVFKNLRHINYLHSSNTENEDVFYAATFQSFDFERVWTEEELHDISEITKILSMYLKSSYVETEREKMLKNRLDYDKNTGLYTLEKFYDESGRITREAKASGGRMGMLHIDIKDMFSINKIHGWVLGNELIDKFAECLKAVDPSKAICSRSSGSDVFIVLFHTTMKSGVAEAVEKKLEEFCAPYAEYKEPPVIFKAGLSMFEPGWNIGYRIDLAKHVKKGKNPDKCVCYENFE